MLPSASSPATNQQISPQTLVRVKTLKNVAAGLADAAGKKLKDTKKETLIKTSQKGQLKNNKFSFFSTLTKPTPKKYAQKRVAQNMFALPTLKISRHMGTQCTAPVQSNRLKINTVSVKVKVRATDLSLRIRHHPGLPQTKHFIRM